MHQSQADLGLFEGENETWRISASSDPALVSKAALVSLVWLGRDDEGLHVVPSVSGRNMNRELREAPSGATRPPRKVFVGLVDLLDSGEQAIDHGSLWHAHVRRNREANVRRRLIYGHLHSTQSGARRRAKSEAGLGSSSLL